MSGFGRLHRVFRISRRHLLYRGLVLATLLNAALLIGAHVSVDPSHGHVTEQANAAENTHKEPFLDRLLDDPVSVLTIGVVIFTGLLVYVTYRLVDSTLLLWAAGEKQLIFLRESSERQLRAYVGVNWVGGVSHSASGHPDKIKIEIKNFGQTPAFRELALFTWLEDSKAVNADPDWLVPQGRPNPTTINPAGTVEIYIENTTRIPMAHSVVLGKITYIDTFGHERWARVRMLSRPNMSSNFIHDTWGNESN